jgi:hypothetical protein
VVLNSLVGRIPCEKYPSVFTLEALLSCLFSPPDYIKTAAGPTPLFIDFPYTKKVY